MLEIENSSIISREEREAVKVDSIYKFTNTNIWKQMRIAKEVQRERPFYINIPAKEIYEDENIDESVLVQGIIDLYYITQDDKLILVDYKTDRVKEREELKMKYKEQLNLYKKALEKAVGQKVYKVYIYSTYLGEEIEI